MSDLADGPETSVTGRRVARIVRAIELIASGTGHDLLRRPRRGDGRGRATASEGLAGARCRGRSCRLGDRERAAGEGGAERVERSRIEPFGRLRLDSARKPCGREAGRDAEPHDPALAADLGDGRGELGPGDPPAVRAYSETRSTNCSTMSPCAPRS
jgi:hypothetical protein